MPFLFGLVVPGALCVLAHDGVSIRAARKRLRQIGHYEERKQSGTGAEFNKEARRQTSVKPKPCCR